MRFAVSYFRNARGRAPTRKTFTWSQFCDDLRRRLQTTAPAYGDDESARQAAKRSLPALGPYRVTEGKTRGNGAVEHVSLLALDIDHCDSVDAIVDALNGTAAVIYGSPSDSPESRRIRVIALPNRPIEPDECEQTRKRFAESLGLGPGCGVERAFEPARLFFVGRIGSDPDREYLELPGDPVDVDQILARPLRHNWRPPKETIEVAARNTDRATAIAALLLPYVATMGSRHAIARAIGGTLGSPDLHWTDDEIAAVVRLLPSHDPDLRVQDALDAADRSYRREAVPQLGELRALVGDEIATNVMHEAIPRSVHEWSARLERRASQASASPAERDSASWEYESFSSPRPPLEYTIPSLMIAPSLGKISLIAGMPGAAKGPLLNYVIAALGLGVGLWGGPAQPPKKIMLLDFEGSRLTMRRLARLARGLGRDPRELEGWVYVHDALSVSDVTDLTWLMGLERECDTLGIELLGVDSYTSAMLTAGVDQNAPEYATFARLLGRLDRSVICVAHTAKGRARSGGPPVLSDVIGSSALAALSQTAIGVHYPDADNHYQIQINCMRAPERRFSPISLEFRDGEDDSLRLTPIEISTPDEPKKPPVKRGADAARAARKAGERIIAHLQRIPTTASRSILSDIGGEGRAASTRALVLLVDAGLVELRAGAYGATETGRTAGHVTIATALGAVAGFQQAK